MRWLLAALGVGGIVWLVTRSSSARALPSPRNSTQSPFVPQPCAAGQVRWTGGLIGAGSQCMSVDEAVAKAFKMSQADGASWAPSLPGTLTGEGVYWFR